jgi:hypothetical protein
MIANIGMTAQASPIVSTRTREHCMRRIGDLSLIVCCSHEFGNDEWREFIDILIASSARMGAPVRGVLYMPTHGPSSYQRALMSQAQDDINKGQTFKRLGLITNSTLARGAMTALSWAMKYTSSQIQVGNTARTREATSWVCEGTRHDVARVTAALDELLVHAGYEATR